LRAYAQSGVLYKFKYVFKGDPEDIKRLEELFHKTMDSDNVKHLMTGVSCREVYNLGEDLARDTINDLVEQYGLNVVLRYEDYTSCNKANHELKYSEDRGVQPSKLCLELFDFGDK
jgi:hypothetical protein